MKTITLCTLSLFICIVMSSPASSASECTKYDKPLYERKLLYNQKDIDDKQKQIDRVTNEINQIDKDLRQEVDYMIAKIELNTNELEELTRKREQIRIDYRIWEAEMLKGEYCSKCERTRSTIEKEYKISFEEHLKKANGLNVRVPKKVMQEGFDKFKRKYEAAFEKMKANWREGDKLDDDITKMEKKAEAKKAELYPLLQTYKNEMNDLAARRRSLQAAYATCPSDFLGFGR